MGNYRVRIDAHLNLIELYEGVPCVNIRGEKGSRRYCSSDDGKYITKRSADELLLKQWMVIWDSIGRDRR